MVVDLNLLSLADLKRLQRDAAKATTDYNALRKAEARASLEEKPRELG